MIHCKTGLGVGACDDITNPIHPVLFPLPLFSHEHSRRRPNCPHIVNQEYIKPASFEFILGNQPDNSAICDINDSTARVTIPRTPIRKNGSATAVVVVGQSTVKSKKFRISVPQSAIKSSVPTVETPQSSRLTSKRPNLKSDLINLFPSLQAQEDKILTWTMEELFEHLIKEKVEMFQDFLNKKIKENDNANANGQIN